MSKTEVTVEKEVEMVVRIACALAKGDPHKAPEALADQAYRVYARILRDVPRALR
jgi:hypothetical protein